METATAKGAPSLWGPPNTLSSFLLQAFACPAPWSPHYVPPGIRSSFISAGFPFRRPPTGATKSLRALGEVLSDCTLTAADKQYKSILTFGSYNKFEKPNLLELLTCVTLIGVSPLVAQQLVLLIKNRLGVSMSRPVSLWCLLLLVLRRLFLPLCALFFVYFYLLLPPVSLSLVAAAAAAAAALLSLPAAAPEALSPFACCFLIPCYAFLFPVPIHVVLGIQLIICALATFICQGIPGTISLQRLQGGGELSTLGKNRGHLVSFADHRSMQMIVTCAAILGVDFLTFPRKFCKSINSGVTLMDLGVGGIIFTSGMVSSHSKGCPNRQESLWAYVSRAALHSGPLGIFGLIRLIFMSLTNLHVSETEYGLHWNFYMTLMVVFVLGELVCVYSGHPYKAGAIGLLLLICYQIIISVGDLEDWMMEGARTNFFSSNREGILGSVGFLCLFLIAVALGHFVVTRSPTQQTRKSKTTNKRLNLLSLVLHLYFFAFLFISFGLLLQEGIGLLARRRFVNLTWVAFVGGIELFAVGTATLSDALAARVCPQWSLKGTNDNQLIIFLLANVCVGAVNISIRTLLQPAVVVWFIMTSYMLILFICAHRLGVAEKRIRIL